MFQTFEYVPYASNWWVQIKPTLNTPPLNFISSIIPRDTSMPKYLLSSLWWYWLSSFQGRGTKLERFLPKNQHTQRKLLNFENLCNGEVSKSAKISHSKSIFYDKNHWNHFSYTKIMPNFWQIAISWIFFGYVDF